jgi:hypothetical protein
LSTTSDAQALARSYLNDADVAAGDVFLDAVLLPFVQSAYRHLQRQLAENGVATMVKESVLTVGASVIVISNTGTTPTLPTGFIVPFSCREKPTGSTEKYQRMSKHVNGLPDVDQTPNLKRWEWRDNSIHLVGATRSIDMLVRHEQQLTDLTQSGGDATVLINGAEEALALRTAAMAARSRGVRAAAKDLNDEYFSEVKSMIRRNRKPEQRRSRRRKPYGHRTHYSQTRY